MCQCLLGRVSRRQVRVCRRTYTLVHSLEPDHETTTATAQVRARALFSCYPEHEEDTRRGGGRSDQHPQYTSLLRRRLWVPAGPTNVRNPNVHFNVVAGQEFSTTEQIHQHDQTHNSSVKQPTGDDPSTDHETVGVLFGVDDGARSTIRGCHSGTCSTAGLL